MDKKEFLKPAFQIIAFNEEDIVTLSGETLGGEDWKQDDNTEDF